MSDRIKGYGPMYLLSANVRWNSDFVRAFAHISSDQKNEYLAKPLQTVLPQSKLQGSCRSNIKEIRTTECQRVEIRNTVSKCVRERLQSHGKECLKKFNQYDCA